MSQTSRCLRIATLIVLLTVQSGCVNTRWTIASLVGGALTFGSGFFAGSVVNTPVTTQTLTQHECFLNDEPIDCASIPDR